MFYSYEEYQAAEDERLGLTCGYRDAGGVEHESFEAACIYYGADTPAQLDAEARWEAAEEAVVTQDAMEARGGPLPPWRPSWADIPF